MRHFELGAMRVANELRYDFKKIVGRIFKENNIAFNEEAFLQNTSIDWEQLTQEAFCYGTNMSPPTVCNNIESPIDIVKKNSPELDWLNTCNKKNSINEYFNEKLSLILKNYT